MTLLQEILSITADWPDWQSDALRRLFANGVLEDRDLADIRLMIEKSEDAPRPIRIDASHIPNLGGGQTTVLRGLRDLQHVNKFTAGRSISFSPDGLNVVFGENGTGKSGYSRVVKRACRARHATPVLPDAFDETPGTPSAGIIVVDERGESFHYDWQEGMSADDRLAMVSVYDSLCGQDYVANEGPCDYQPYGLPYLGELTQAQILIQSTISTERKAILLDPSGLSALIGDHEVGRTVRDFGPETDLDALRVLAALSDAEAQRIGEIERIQLTLDVETPAKAAETLAKRLDQAVAMSKAIEAVTADCAIDRLHELTAAVQSAIEADRTAQLLLRGDDAEEFAQTGSSAWKSLFQAAQRFSMEVYPQADDHPSGGEEARCVLCQQDLPPAAQQRLQRFRAYVAGEAATTLAEANARLTKALEMIAQARAEILDEATAIELREFDPAILELIELAKRAWEARQQWAADAASSGNWCCPRPSPLAQPLPSSVLAEKAQLLRDKAAELRASLDQEQILALSKEHVALLAKRSLVTLLPQVERHVLNSRKIKYLTELEGQLQTKTLSTRITKLSQKYVTEALAAAMREELAWLGLRSPLPVLKARTDYGANLMTLSLESTRKAPGDILSEGEQRAMGLALFLAEARLRGDLSTIVLDDPSTSIDHRFRARIAKRIVALAQERHVVVFTHDAVFLTQLQMAASDAGIEPCFQTVQWDGGAPGAVIEGLAWENMTFNKQLKDIYKDAEALAASSNPHLNDQEKRAVRELSSRIRGAIERGVREIVLNDTVHPFSDEIKVARIGGIIGFGLEEWEVIVGLHDQCSGLTSAHDTNADRQQELPHPTEILSSLKQLEAVITACSQRWAAFNNSHYKPRMAKRSAIRER